jgi:hypothetical protein
VKLLKIGALYKNTVEIGVHKFLDQHLWLCDSMVPPHTTILLLSQGKKLNHSLWRTRKGKNVRKNYYRYYYEMLINDEKYYMVFMSPSPMSKDPFQFFKEII